MTRAQQGDQRAYEDRLRLLATEARGFVRRGVYLNYTPEDRVRDAYGAAKYARLVDLTGRYDPDDLIRLNRNIRPARMAGMS